MLVTPKAADGTKDITEIGQKKQERHPLAAAFTAGFIRSA